MLVEELAAAVCADEGGGHLRRHAGAERLLSDVLGDVVRPESARTLYGVAIDLEAGRVDREATSGLRATMARQLAGGR